LLQHHTVMSISLNWQLPQERGLARK